MEISSTPSGVRKGAWTEEEDILLRKCIEKYGEGKWHQVPLRAGLNRCRKSCRLRWLNYLRPNIKRGGFASDEVDLIIRLHKLLGNRWTLIAGRLPGRTANDVKNYWNTHLQKKKIKIVAREEEDAQKTIKTKVIKPRPHTISKNLTWLWGNNSTSVDNIQSTAGNSLIMTKPTLTSLPLGVDGSSTPWWDDMLVHDKEIDNGITSWSISGLEEQPITGLWTEEMIARKIAGDIQEVQNGWFDFSFDLNLWDLLSDEKET